MKKLFFLFIGCMFLYFIAYPSKAFLASQAGLLLWFNQILPTLLPFSILSNILLTVWDNSSDQEIHSFLHITKREWFIIFCGMLFGFPIGSKLTADIYKSGYTTEERAKILCAFTNNMSPAFVSSYVCSNILKNSAYTLPMFIMLYGPPFIIGCFRLSRAPIEQNTHKKSASRFQLDMQIIDAGIVSSFVTLIKLCGYIVIFSITADLFLHIRFLPNPIKYLMVGLTEVTNGIAQLSYIAYPERTKILMAVLFLSLGGLSGLAQTNSMLSDGGLPIKNYIYSKLLYAACSVLLCLCILFLGDIVG